MEQKINEREITGGKAEHCADCFGRACGRHPARLFGFRTTSDPRVNVKETLV